MTEDEIQSLVDKVQLLEQEKKELETKLSIKHREVKQAVEILEQQLERIAVLEERISQLEDDDEIFQ